MLLAFFWGMTWWHEFATIAAALGLMDCSWDKGEDARLEEVCGTFINGQAHILALHDVRAESERRTGWTPLPFDSSP